MAFLGEFTKIPFVLAFVQPSRDLFANDTHDTAVIVEDGPVVFVRSSLGELRPHTSAVVADRVPDAGPGVFHQIEDHVEDGMID